MDLIIDGYNLIFQCGLEGRSADSRALERARERLIRELARFTSTSDELRQCTVVFDAKNQPIKATEKEYSVDGIQVIFAADFDEADALIEKLIRQHSTPKKLVVVSSDHRIQKAAAARRATAVDSDAWYETNVEARANPTAPESQRTPNSVMSSEEISALKAKFQMSDDELAKSLANPVEGKELLPSDGETDLDIRRKSDEFGLDEEIIEKLGGDLDDLNPFPPGYGDDVAE